MDVVELSRMEVGKRVLYPKSAAVAVANINFRMESLIDIDMPPPSVFVLLVRLVQALHISNHSFCTAQMK